MRVQLFGLEHLDRRPMRRESGYRADPSPRKTHNPPWVSDPRTVLRTHPPKLKRQAEPFPCADVNVSLPPWPERGGTETAGSGVSAGGAAVRTRGEGARWPARPSRADRARS